MVAKKDYIEDSISTGNGGVVSDINLQICVDEVVAKLGGGQNKDLVVVAASKILDSARLLWQPQIVYRWVKVTLLEAAKIELRCDHSDQSVTLDLGFSTRFVKETRHALIGVCTVGEELEAASTKCSAQGKPFDGYLYDIVALLVMGKLKHIVSRIAQNRCMNLGWGVSPFLSPGSVHGWDLEEQKKLCSMLPLDIIGVEIEDNAVLRPFISISFLIGIGSGYQATTVGSSCEVCSKRDSCVMRNKE